MSIVKRARNYLLDETFNMRVLKNKIDVNGVTAVCARVDGLSAGDLRSRK